MKHVPAAFAPPVAVGGVGGSGTRIVARLLQAAGIHIGDDLNDASDTLWFTLLFKRPDILQLDDAQFDALARVLSDVLAGTAMFDAPTAELLLALARVDRSPQHDRQWMEARARSLIAAGTSHAGPFVPRRWGWKEPNTHIVIERLWKRLPTLRYVHVVRHGVDMAFSANQNQLQMWGPHVLGEDGPVTPRRSLAYWCRVQQRMQRLCELDDRVYWLDYDRLCADPVNTVSGLCRFLNCSPDVMAPALDEVRPPAQPRHSARSLSVFHPADLEYVRSLGFVLEAG